MAPRPATLVLGTQNLDKLRESWRCGRLAHAGAIARSFSTHRRAVEHGATLEANAALKASYYATTPMDFGRPHGVRSCRTRPMPGVLTARYAGNDAAPAQNLARAPCRTGRRAGRSAPRGRRVTWHWPIPTGAICATSCGHCHGQIACELPPDDAALSGRPPVWRRWTFRAGRDPPHACLSWDQWRIAKLGDIVAAVQSRRCDLPSSRY